LGEGRRGHGRGLRRYESRVTRDDFDREEWLTLDDVARKFRYATTDPIKKAIRRGELQAHVSPCGRRTLVLLADYGRYRDSLRHRPISRPSATGPAATPARRTTRRRSQMPIPH
jgi:hypothetical protein